MLDNEIVEKTESSNVFCLIDNDDSRINVDRVPTTGDDACLEAQHYTWFWLVLVDGMLFLIQDKDGCGVDAANPLHICSLSSVCYSKTEELP